MLNKILIIIGLTIVAFIIFYFGFSFFIASQTVRTNHSQITIPATSISNTYENISIKTSNSTLSGWLFLGQTNKLIIMVPGIRENRINNSYYGSLIAKDLIALGYNVLLYDNQATGESTGNYVTFGIKESEDLISVVDFAKTKGFEAKNIAIIGDDMGANTLLLASDKLKNIGAMVVDSATSNAKKTLENILLSENHVPAFFHQGIFFVLKYVYNLDLTQINPITHIQKAPDRIFLFLHGGKDTIIDPSESRILKAVANSNSSLIIFPDAGHVETYKNNPDFYRNTVFTFLTKNLK